MTEPPPTFLNIHALLEQSQPRPRSDWFRYAMVVFLVLVVSSWMGGKQPGPLQQAVNVLATLAMLLMMIGMALLTWQSVRRQRDEQRQIESIEELIQLRRWPQAAAMLGAMLSVPARSLSGRIQGLLYLSAVLARYQRYQDVIEVQEHVLDSVELDPGPEYALRLSRGVALLHEDRLLDADRALAELRRLTGGEKTAGLLLVEIYRDVKTGHPEEAIELFTKHQVMLRDQLGHRVGDLWALAARAYDLLDHPVEARSAYANAMLLVSEEELIRRYPELAALKGKWI